ncbi:MAG: chromate resistance protein [Chloroflexi bacterium]|nr:chromate resistance protein [Chloroflexota bacterium]
MRWITRRNLHVDRTACPWLIRKYLDPEAEFVFVPAGTDPATLERHSFDMRGAEYGHEGEKCTFQVMLERHHLQGDPALVEMGRIIRDADVPPSRTRRPEAAGLDALIRGFQLAVPDDREKLRLTAPLYDALYAYCQAKVAGQPLRQGVPRPRLGYSRRVAMHLAEEESKDDPSAGT